MFLSCRLELLNFHYSPENYCNMEPKKGGLEDDFPFQTDDFQVPCEFSGV